MFQRALALEQAQEGEAGYSKLTRKYEGQPSFLGDGCPSVSICEGLVCWFWCVTITSLRWIGVRQTDAALVVVDRKKARVAAPPTG